MVVVPGMAGCVDVEMGEQFVAMENLVLPVVVKHCLLSNYFLIGKTSMKQILLLSFCILLIASVAIAGEGHEAGRDWAEENSIDDPDECRSADSGRWDDDNIKNSPSFTAGCLEYLNDEGLTDDDDELIGDDDSDDEDEDEDED